MQEADIPQIDLSADEILKAIEFSVESRMNLDSDEQVTIITHPLTIKAIKIGIAQGKIFKDIYSRIIFSPDSNSKLSDLIIIPDHIIDEVIQNEIQEHLNTDKDVQEKMKILNDKMDIPEETLNRISTLKDEELTTEELSLKCEIQSLMLEVGMNIDLQFSDRAKNEQKVDQILDKLLESNKVQKVGLEGIRNE
jgi:hypothetical protein